MRELKVAKFQVYDTLSAVKIFYGIFIAIIIFLALLNLKSGGNSSSGLETASVIFLFITGLNSFRTSFYFSQANNITRKAFFKGLVIGMLPITLSMAIIDIIINRVYNIFVHSPMTFDMIYTAYRDTGLSKWSDEAQKFIWTWTQSYDISTVLVTALWEFSLYSAVVFLGILISLIYFRSNKIVKILVSITPVILILVSNLLYFFINISLWHSIGNFISMAVGWETRNPYIAVVSFILLSLIFVFFIYLLCRKAVIKEQ